MNKGFTLLELIVVIIIIGVLGSLGFTQYTTMVEKGRTAEAKMILASIRGAQEAYRLEKGEFSSTMDNLSVYAPAACEAKYYFKYSITKAAGTGDTATFEAKAERCGTSEAGKSPGASKTYSITVTQDGKFDSSDSKYK